MDYLDNKKLKIVILKLYPKGRIHSQIGSIPELFYESKVDIRELVLGFKHFVKSVHIVATSI
jgi:hypothetical protein